MVGKKTKDLFEVVDHEEKVCITMLAKMFVRFCGIGRHWGCALFG